ncbi:MAG: hypothetical protein RID09_31500 [Coleofasciculus sp. G1-WW12-02]
MPNPITLDREVAYVLALEAKLEADYNGGCFCQHRSHSEIHQ